MVNLPYIGLGKFLKVSYPPGKLRTSIVAEFLHWQNPQMSTLEVNFKDRIVIKIMHILIFTYDNCYCRHNYINK